MQGIKRQEAVFKAEFSDEMLRHRNLVRLLVGNHFMPEDELLSSQERREYLNHFLILEMIETSPDSLAVETDLNERS